MKLLVLAGGFGKRLKTEIANLPKALAPVGDVPFLKLQIEQWRAQGLNEFTFLLHHKADQIIEFLQAQQFGVFKDCKIDWLIESKPLGTGGAVAHAVKKKVLNQNFLLTNADTWLDGGIRILMGSTAPAIAVINLQGISRYGQVHFEQSNYVTAFVEKNTQSTSGWINAGLYHLSPGLFKNWNGQAFSLEHDFFENLVQNRSLKAVQLQTNFIDIGVPDDYNCFCRWVKSGRRIPLCN